MVEFLDGPARGQTLMLHRIPIFLRAVHSQLGGWDALDQIEDVAKRDEEITVYRRRDDLEITKYHLLTGHRRRAGSGWYFNCKYSVLPEQPPDEILRDTRKWQAWALTQVPDQLKDSP